MLRIAAPTVIIAALLLAGCTSPAPAPIETPAADADEYLAAVKDNPESWLYTDPEKVDPQLMFLSACMIDGAAATPVCVDAKSDGYLDE